MRGGVRYRGGDEMGWDVRRREVCRGVGARTEEHEERVDEDREEREGHDREDLHTRSR